ncbi:MAG: yjdF [Nitrospira sp.]|jgi:putative membrane protein|nr:yjdF [Nitrospira sp.]
MEGPSPGWTITPFSGNRRLHWLIAGYAALWAGLAVAPLDRSDWLLENILAILLGLVLATTYRWFQFSDLSYALIVAFMFMHAIGAHYTYAEVPFGFWLQETFGLARNPFDRLVHAAYGLLLVYPIREFLMRQIGLRGFWSYYLPVSAVLAQSGFFELVERLVVMITNPELGQAYLGTQGDEWDAQHDMASALFGALFTMAVIYLHAQSQKTPASLSH